MEKLYRLITVIVETDNITQLSSEVCEKLQVGDVVNKITNGQKHRYTVSYKEDGVGMCLTYTDASRVETVSYDFTDGEWVYNSTDITEIGGEPTPSGTKLYKHTLTIPVSYDGDDFDATCIVISTSNQSFKNKAGCDLYELGYVSALIQTNPDVSTLYPVALFTYESEPHILYVSDYSSVESIAFADRISNDVITEL